MRIRHQLAAYSPVSAKAALLATGQLFGLGDDPRPVLRALLEREYGAASVLLCGSGTQALTVAIQEAQRRVDPDAPVALPAFSCFDVASAAVGADVRVSLYDLDPDTLGPDLESLERVLRAGAGVVVVAPLYGIPVDWDALETLAARYNAVLVEDAAQGNGASWKGKRLGSLGEIAVLSFGRGKGWTGGSGGAVLMYGDAEPAREDFSEPGFSRRSAVSLAVLAQWALARPAVYGIPASIPALGLGETTYVTPRPVKSIARSAAAALIATYEAAKNEAAARQANTSRLVAGLADNPEVQVIPAPRGGISGYLRLPVRLKKGREALDSGGNARQLGIVTSYPISLGTLPQLAGRLGGPERVWPGAQILVKELMTLPAHSHMRPTELEEVIRIFQQRPFFP
jgi:dTDP-4-amino-4,6-dideoxygalactose transaminase